MQRPPFTSEKGKARTLTRSESLAEARLGASHWADTGGTSLSHVMSSTLNALKGHLGTEISGLSILALMENGAVSTCTGYRDSVKR